MSTTPADEVDRIVEAWHRERPDLDVAPLQVLSRVSRLARHLDLARGAAFAEHGLEGWEFDVLSALRRVGAPYQLSPGQLVAQTLVTCGTMTNRVDRLERRGFVGRSPDPNDRRGVIVALTPTGRDVVDSAMADLLARERVLLAGLGAGERASLADALRGCWRRSRRCRAGRRTPDRGPGRQPRRGRAVAPAPSRGPRRAVEPLHLERLALVDDGAQLGVELEHDRVVGRLGHHVGVDPLLGGWQLRSCRSIRPMLLAGLADLGRRECVGRVLGGAPDPLGAAAPLRPPRAATTDRLAAARRRGTARPRRAGRASRRRRAARPAGRTPARAGSGRARRRAGCRPSRRGRPPARSASRCRGRWSARRG